MAERDIKHAIREALGSAPSIVVWNNPCGFDHVKNAHYGLIVGASDLIGIRDDGRFVALEVKTERGRLRPEQTLFLDLIRRMNGIAAVVRSPAEARKAVGL